MDDYLKVTTTTANKEEALSIARHLVEKKLAACCQVLGPQLSIFRWQGKVQEEREWLLVIKTRRALFADVEAAIKDLHSYETPEIIAFPIALGSSDYLAWLGEETV